MRPPSIASLRRAGESATRLTLPRVVSPNRSRILKCCLIGPTNAGKSTLLNKLLDKPISAVSPKIHTTRENTLGYLTDHELATQVEFIDAPGSLGPDVPSLHREVWEAVTASQIALVCVDSSDKISHLQVGSFLKRLGNELKRLDEEQPGSRPQTALVLNKVDRIHKKDQLLGISQALHDDFAFDWPPFMVSARKGGGIKNLRDWLLLASKPGDWIAAEGVHHLQTPLARATEIIREQLFRFYRKEIPYMIEQRNVGWTELEKPEGGLRIDQQLIVPKKASVVRILHSRLPGVADAARKMLRDEFGRVVFLHLSLGWAGPNETANALGDDDASAFERAPG